MYLSIRGPDQKFRRFFCSVRCPRVYAFVVAGKFLIVPALHKMNRVFKTLLLWLLVALLPLRGIAAVDASCARVSHPAPAGISQQHDSHVDIAANETAMADIQRCVNQSPVHGAMEPEGAGCNGAACLVAAVAPPLSLAAVPMDAGSQAVDLPLVESFTGHIPAGIDRPPRHIAA